MRQIEYLSPATEVNMSDGCFQIAGTDHFWVRRRFEVLQKLAGGIVSGARGDCRGRVRPWTVCSGKWKILIEAGDRFRFECIRVEAQREPDAAGCAVTTFIRQDEEFRRKFDLILLFDVLEHIPDEDSFVQAILFHSGCRGSFSGERSCR